MKIIYIKSIGAALAIFLMLPSTKTEQASTHFFNPGPAVKQNCKAIRFTAYENKTGHPIYLVAMDIWMGLYKDAYADITVAVYRASDAMMLGGFQWDRYANPTGDHHRLIRLPVPFLIGDGDGLMVDGLNCHVSGRKSPMHPTVLFYFSD